MRVFKLAAVVTALAAVTMIAMAQQPGGTPATQTPSQGASGPVPDGKIAVINTGLFPEQIGELKQKYEQVNNQFQDRFKKVQDQDQQLKQLENDLVTKGVALSQDKQQEMREQYELRKKQRERDAEDFQIDYNKALDLSTKPIREKLHKSVDNFARQRGIVLIIRLPEAYQTGMLAFSSPGVDITDDFVAEYNKANPVPAGAAPVRPAPTGTAAPQTKPKQP